MPVTPASPTYYYVYLFVDQATGTHHYTGHTTDLAERLNRHNTGRVPHTAPFAPWRIETAIAFTDETKARAFEAYLKTHSGRAFASRHF